MLAHFSAHQVFAYTHGHMNNDSAIVTKSCTISNEQQEKEVIFITLGDGDFTWSLDFGRYLFTTISSSMNDDNDGVFGRTNVRLIATGIDSLNEFQQKYRNYKYILRELEKLNTKSRPDNNRIQVEVLHEVNAIIHSSTSSMAHKRGHVVIFNHPHLGTEDAKLHSQFLCHLFHSVNHYWMVPSAEGGVFHLTLANGQYERWQCHTAAQRHRMKLIQQSIFVPNPSIAGYTSVYGHRRHQTGKSFASRTSGSTTYTFVRENDDTTNHNHISRIQLPWFVQNDKSSNDGTNTLQASSFICSLCDKQFGEERSLTNHVASVHNNKRKRSENHPTKFVCDQCNIRCFDTSEALNDHMLAKHKGIHSTIVPDWVTRHTVTLTNLANEHNTTHLVDATCTICDAAFETVDDRTDHYKLFIPSLIDTIKKVELIQCRYCQKSFRQVRAQQQHENFCSSRLDSIKDH